MIRAALPLALLAAAASAADRVPDATPSGPAQSCIPLSGILETKVRSDSIIDFIMRSRRAYRVTLPDDCPGLGFEQRFAYATSQTQLCQQDIITVFSTGPVMRGASCGLAPFQPVTLAKQAR